MYIATYISVVVQSDTVLNSKYNSLFGERIGPLLSFLAAGSSEKLSLPPAGTFTPVGGGAVDSDSLGLALAQRRKELHILLID